MQKLLALKKDYEREGFHLQRLYKRRAKDEYGIMRSTLDIIMEPIKKKKSSSTSKATTSNTCDCNCEEEIKKVAEHCDENAAETKEYVDSALTWKEGFSG